MAFRRVSSAPISATQGFRILITSYSLCVTLFGIYVYACHLFNISTAKVEDFPTIQDNFKFTRSVNSHRNVKSGGGRQKREEQTTESPHTIGKIQYSSVVSPPTFTPPNLHPHGPPISSPVGVKFLFAGTQANLHFCPR